jgi:hypothetical protein
MHPYLRLFISQLITLLNIYLGYKIFSNFLYKKAVVVGLLIALFNPLYIWWGCVRSGPEIYITVFLGSIIYFSVKLLKKNQGFYLIPLFILIPFSLLFKPVLFLIPLFMLIYFSVYKKYKIVPSLLLLFILSITSLKIIIDYTKPINGLAYGDKTIMFDAFFTEIFLKTGQLGFYQGGGNKPIANSNTEYIYSNINRWTTEYTTKYHNDDPIKMNLEFIKEKAPIILISKFLNPIYYISFADSTVKTVFNFVINTTILTLSFVSLKRIKKKYPAQSVLLFFIFMGCYSVYFLTTSIARYFIPVLFYFSIFAGVYITEKLKIEEEIV